VNILLTPMCPGETCEPLHHTQNQAAAENPQIPIQLMKPNLTHCKTQLSQTCNDSTNTREPQKPLVHQLVPSPNGETQVTPTQITTHQPGEPQEPPVPLMDQQSRETHVPHLLLTPADKNLIPMRQLPQTASSPPDSPLNIITQPSK